MSAPESFAVQAGSGASREIVRLMERVAELEAELAWARVARERDKGKDDRRAGFADCEARLIVLLERKAASESEKAAARAPQGAERSYHEARADALREAALAVALGHLRTAEMPDAALVAAHRGFVNRSQAAKAGRTVTPARSEASRRNAAKARAAKAGREKSSPR